MSASWVAALALSNVCRARRRIKRPACAHPRAGLPTPLAHLQEMQRPPLPAAAQSARHGRDCQPPCQGTQHVCIEMWGEVVERRSNAHAAALAGWPHVRFRHLCLRASNLLAGQADFHLPRLLAREGGEVSSSGCHTDVQARHQRYGRTISREVPSGRSPHSGRASGALPCATRCSSPPSPSSCRRDSQARPPGPCAPGGCCRCRGA
jgi:hypothetical protein